MRQYQMAMGSVRVGSSMPTKVFICTGTEFKSCIALQVVCIQGCEEMTIIIR